ncbi:KipI family sensor histidine kinase inhibitor [Rhodanobacter sp. ANJX3]|uniref:5-oxoprolinase subunit PxpB n=1 Tax=Rhodanobacter sp. ANJX3 TaxID=2723083 RepID=UPI0017EEA27C|nr:KipI family sensor histidine kinase inhibitor [Rhodanobacter sp. ANJX3]
MTRSAAPPISAVPPAVQWEAMAENALLLRFGDTIDSSLNTCVHAATAHLRERLPTLEYVPAYASVLLRFDPAHWPALEERSPHQQLGDAVIAALADLSTAATASALIEIPVLYDGPDLTDVAALTGFSIEDVIVRHGAVEYRVAMLGFAPGFPYLLGLDPALAVPRRTDPRQRVPAGSVAIGGRQTGIYPTELPGGWQLIGRTPLQLFDVAADVPSLLAAGDRVRFRAIDRATFQQIAKARSA